MITNTIDLIKKIKEAEKKGATAEQIKAAIAKQVQTPVPEQKEKSWYDKPAEWIESGYHAVEEQVGKVPYIGGVLQAPLKGAEYLSTLPWKGVAGTLGSIEEGGKSIYQGGKEMYQGYTKPSEQYKIGSGFSKMIQGGLGIAMAPAAGSVAMMPKPLQGKTETILGAPSSLAQFGARKLAKILGVPDVIRMSDADLEKKIQEALKKGATKEQIQTSLAKIEPQRQAFKEGVLGPAGTVGDLATILALAKGGKAAKSIKQYTVDYLKKQKDAKFIKLKNDIKIEVNDLIEGNKSFSKKVNDALKLNTDIKKQLSDPFVYRGLKVENGVINPEQAIRTIQNKIDLLMDAKSKVLPQVSKYTPKITKKLFREKAINELKLEGLTPADAKMAIKRLDIQLESLPNEISIIELDLLRAQSRKSSRLASGQQKPSSEYTAMENASRDLIFETTDNLLINRKGEFAALNQQIKDLIVTLEFLNKNIKGAKVKGGRLGKITGRIIGSITGTPGGILGSILGSEIGGIVADIVMNNQLGSALKMKLISKFIEDPAVLSQIEALVKEIELYEMPKLEAPTTEFKSQMPSGKTIELPSKSESTIEAEEIGLFGKSSK